MTDIVKRLRNPPFGTETSERNIMTHAANEIERLRDVISRAREMLDADHMIGAMELLENADENDAE